MLSPEERAGWLEEARDPRRREVLRRVRRDRPRLSPAELLDWLDDTAAWLGPLSKEPRRPIRGDRFLL